MLETFRQKLLLPTYLSQEQQKRIYRLKFQQQLQNDPITLEIDGVVYKFRYTNRMELPHARDLIRRALNAMKTPDDLRNLSPLLQACKRAHRKIDLSFYPKMIRLAARAGCLHMILDMARAVGRTHFKLDTSEKVNTLLAFLQKRAVDSGWDRDKTREALRQTQLVLNMMESEPLHQPKPATAGRFPFYRDPQVLAARLHLAAAIAVHHQDGKDVDGKVTKYGEELVRLWPEGYGLLDLQPDEAFRDRRKMFYMLNRSTYLFMASPVLNGLTLAAQVADPGLTMQLQNRADAVESEIRAALSSEDVKEGSLGKVMYNRLFNPEAEGEEAEGEEEGVEQ